MQVSVITHPWRAAGVQQAACPPADMPTRPEAHVHKVVKDDGHLAVAEGMQHHFPLEMLVPGVAGVDGDRSVSQHRLDTGGRHDHFLV